MPFCKISTKAFSAVGNQQRCRRDLSPKNSCIGILRPCALETNGNLGRVLELSDDRAVYWHWEFNLRDHALTFPAFQRHVEPSFAFDLIIGHEL